MKVVTVATHSYSYFPILKDSCKRNYIDIEVLGWGEHWTGFQFKFKKMEAFSKQILKDEEWIIFIDAFDVLVLNNVQFLENFLLEMENQGKDMVVVTEYYYPIVLRKRLNELVFGSFRDKNICSGLYAVKKHRLEDMLTMINQNYDMENEILDDQMLLIWYLNNAKNQQNIYIDDDGEIFYNALMLEPNKTIFRDGSILNVRTMKKQRPVFVHFPANQDFSSICTYFNYDLPQQVKEDNSIWKKIKYQKKRGIFFLENGKLLFFLTVLFFGLILCTFQIRDMIMDSSS